MSEFVKKNRIGLLLLAAGILFAFVGVYRQEIATVCTKASAICLECIGIG